MPADAKSQSLLQSLKKNHFLPDVEAVTLSVSLALTDAAPRLAAEDAIPSPRSWKKMILLMETRG